MSLLLNSLGRMLIVVSAKTGHTVSGKKTLLPVTTSLAGALLTKRSIA